MEGIEWLHLPNIELRTGALAVAEVRDGPSDDMIVLRLAAGTFRPCLGIATTPPAEGDIISVRIVHERALGGWGRRTEPGDVVRGGVLGWLSTELCNAGVFDYGLMADLARQDPVAFRTWSDGFYDRMDWPYGFTSFGADSRATLFYAQGKPGGGHYPVSELLQDDEPVGVEVAFSAALVDETDVARGVSAERIVNPTPILQPA